MSSPTLLLLSVLLLLTLATRAHSQCPRYKTRKVTGKSSAAAGLTSRVDLFRDILGTPNNLNEVGSFPTGRREVNWDAPIVPFDMPGDFFNTMVPRGLVLSTPGDEFRVSNSEMPPDDLFDSIAPAALSAQFTTFSSPRLFTPLITNRLEAEFRVSGSDDVAAVTGFGAVFVDVDRKGSYLDYFDCDGCFIGRVRVPRRNRGLSFAGLVVEEGSGDGLRAVVCKVKFRLGGISLSGFADIYDGTFVGDVVVLDDFVYGEPQVV